MTILGAGGHGHDIAAIIGFTHEILFLDDGPGDYGPTSYLDGPYLIGINDCVTREKLDARDHFACTAIHPTVIKETALLSAPGLVVGAFTSLGPDVTVGRHVHIGAGCTITRTTIGDYTTIGPGVNIGGDCTIGQRVSVGVGSAISNLVTIGNAVTIGAGTVVPPKRTLDAGTWVGNPARRIA